MEKIRLHDLDEGREELPREGDLDDAKALAEAKEGKPHLLNISEGALAKYVRGRWDRMDKQAQKIQNELRVNYLRYEGEPFAQVHPSDPNRVYIPNAAKTRLPPTINKMRRMVHRYTAQVTADEPVLEGAPANHTNKARDAAEAVTHALRSEWQRLHLERELRSVAEVFAVMRSGFWSFEYDPVAGGKTPAQKFFKNPDTGEDELHYVGSGGQKVSTPDDAAEIWEGNITVETMTPMNVRWGGGKSVDDAQEVMTAKVINLGQLYEMSPETRDVKIKNLVGEVDLQAQEWLNDIRGASGIEGRNRSQGEADLDSVGSKVEDSDSILDEPVLLINYYRPDSRAYPGGLHAIVAGKHLIWRGELEYGVVPVAQFRCLWSIRDPLGLSLVDLLKDPQELMDFVFGQILRFLQSMKRRWFVPLTSGVNSRDLLNPTRSIIHYNANSGPPIPEQVPEIPRTMVDWVDRLDAAFDDEAGIHDTMQGKHVPGVSSGRHAEALRAGDETILGLTRTQIVAGLEKSGLIMLNMIKKEWTRERRVRYFADRQYVERAFSGTNFGETSNVVLKRGTLLMLTQAQKLETLFSYAEMGAITPQELRKLAPIVDTAGISTTEDPHYVRARRENTRFLDGPPPKLAQARKAYETAVETLISDTKFAEKVVGGGDPQSQRAAELLIQEVEGKAQAVESEWEAQIGLFKVDTFEEWESMPRISEIHFEEHAIALSSEKTSDLPSWWADIFRAHTMKHLQAMMPPPEAGAEGQPEQPQPQGPPM